MADVADAAEALRGLPAQLEISRRLFRGACQPGRRAGRHARRSLGVFARAGRRGAGPPLPGDAGGRAAARWTRSTRCADDLKLFTDADVECLPAWESDAGERVLLRRNLRPAQRLLKRLG